MTLTGPSHKLVRRRIHLPPDIVIHGVAHTSTQQGSGEVDNDNTLLAQPRTPTPTVALPQTFLFPPAPLPTTPQPNFLPPAPLSPSLTADFANSQFRGKMKSHGVQPKIRNLQYDRTMLSRLRNEEGTMDGQPTTAGPSGATTATSEPDAQPATLAYSVNTRPEQGTNRQNPSYPLRGPDGRFIKSKK